MNSFPLFTAVNLKATLSVCLPLSTAEKVTFASGSSTFSKNNALAAGLVISNPAWALEGKLLYLQTVVSVVQPSRVTFKVIAFFFFKSIVSSYVHT
jgi:hypothetical protein